MRRAVANIPCNKPESFITNGRMATATLPQFFILNLEYIFGVRVPHANRKGTLQRRCAYLQEHLTHDAKIRWAITHPVGEWTRTSWDSFVRLVVQTDLDPYPWPENIKIALRRHDSEKLNSSETFAELQSCRIYCLDNYCTIDLFSLQTS